MKAKTIAPRQHPGANQQKVAFLPPRIARAIERAIGDHPTKKLVKDGILLEQYLKARHAPTEALVIRQRSKNIQAEVEKEMNVDVTSLDEDQLHEYQKAVEKRVEKLLKSRTFAWKALDYDEYRSKMYLFARAAQDYAALVYILKEISQRDPKFKPRSFIDFGSGVGTGTWAVSELWKDSIFEYYNVDSSGHMNTLAELILQDGEENKQRMLREVYYRQFLGAPTTSYDLCLSAFSLIELPNRKTRLDVIKNLWERCTGYLILIELGTNTGFKLIKEARDFLIKNTNGDGYLFAPCPHELTCPRFKIADGTPCNFETKYFPLRFVNSREPMRDRFSYLVFKKGPNNEDPETHGWPRLVRETTVRSRHTFCRTCTREGQLREIIVTPGKHGKIIHQCAKRSKWGDRLPFHIENIENDEVKSDNNASRSDSESDSDDSNPSNSK